MAVEKVSPVLADSQAQTIDQMQGHLNEQFEIQHAVELPKTSMEQIIQELRFLRALISRDRQGYFAARADMFEKLYEVAQDEEEASYVDRLLNAATIASVFFNLVSVVAITSPEKTGFLSDCCGPLNPFQACKRMVCVTLPLPSETYDYTKLTRAATKMCSSLGRIVDAGKGWRENSNQGKRVGIVNVKDLTKLRMDRYWNENSTASQDFAQGIRDDETMQEKRRNLVQVLTRA